MFTVVVYKKKKRKRGRERLTEDTKDVVVSLLHDTVVPMILSLTESNKIRSQWWCNKEATPPNTSYSQKTTTHTRFFQVIQDRLQSVPKNLVNH